MSFSLGGMFSAFDDAVIQPFNTGNWHSLAEMVNNYMGDIDPAMYAMLDNNASLTGTLAGDFGRDMSEYGLTGDERSLGDAIRRAGDRDRKNPGRATENAALVAGSVLTGSWPAGVAGAAAGSVASGGDEEAAARGYLRGSYAGSAGDAVSGYGQATGWGEAASRAAGAAAGGAAASGMSGGNLGDMFKSGAIGALTAGAIPDIAGAEDINNPQLRSALNNGIRGGLTAAAKGGNSQQITTGAAMAGLPGLFSYATQTEDPYGLRGGYNPPNQGLSMLGPNPEAPSMPSVSGPPQEGFSLSPSWYQSQGFGLAPQQTDVGNQPGAATPGGGLTDKLSQYLSSLTSNKERLGDGLSNLMGLYAGYRQYQQANQLRDMFGRNRGAYEAQLRAKLMAKDAQMGRRSNYAGRETQLQAALAELDSRAMPGLLSLGNERFSGLNNMLRSGYGMGQAAGAWGWQPPKTYNGNVPYTQTYSSPYPTGQVPQVSPSSPISLPQVGQTGASQYYPEG